MPSQVRIISPRNSARWDTLIQGFIDAGAWKQQQTYFGCVSQDRADKVRRALRTAGKHLGISVYAFWTECGGCNDGGTECRYHVNFSIHTMEEAREYKARQAQQLAASRR